jgi:formate-dependent nitrite reductase membrane component NrfD
MWQNPLLPPHLLVQALLLGSAVLLLIAAWVEGTSIQDVLNSRIVTTAPVLALSWSFAITSLLHLLMIWGEVSLTHSTAHARLAVWEMVRGRYKSDFWIGMALSLVGGLLPWLAIFGYLSPSLAVAGAPLALVGMMLYENAYVQAGQSVPLA